MKVGRRVAAVSVVVAVLGCRSDRAWGQEVVEVTASGGPSQPVPESTPVSNPVPAPTQTSLADQQAESAPAPEKKPPLGFLSDPDVPAENLADALFAGKIHFDNRFRVEYADTTGKKVSWAVTNRLRLGYESKPFHGLTGLVEMEMNVSPNPDDYSVPPTGSGEPDRTTIADPTGIELNRAWGRYNTKSVFDSGASFDLKGGRQRIIIDDSRFIGNVGWRQFEQTFDAANVKSDFGVDNLEVMYAYIWYVQRIFGPHGPSWDSDSHLIHASYKVMPELKITPFVYLLDFLGSSPINSVDNYGIRFTGDIDRDPDDPEDLFFDYEATYAYQTTAGSNPVDAQMSFFAAQGRLSKKGFGAVAIGYQFLGSDDGKYGFRFPLGTNHKFQGFADQFLVTPATGLQDLYIVGALDLPYGIKSAAFFHQFWSDEGGVNLGHEIDFVLSKKITSIWSVLLKGAFFDGHNGQPDTTRVTLQTTVKF